MRYLMITAHLLPLPIRAPLQPIHNRAMQTRAPTCASPASFIQPAPAKTERDHPGMAISGLLKPNLGTFISGARWQNPAPSAPSVRAPRFPHSG
jgi:hypothetical protein